MKFLCTSRNPFGNSDIRAKFVTNVEKPRQIWNVQHASRVDYKGEGNAFEFLRRLYVFCA